MAKNGVFYVVVVGNGDEVPLGKPVLRLDSLHVLDTEWDAVFALEEGEVAVQVTVVNWFDFDGLGDEFADPKE